MKQLLEVLKRTDIEDRIRVLRLEIDYELANLHDAMIAQDVGTMTECKRKLENFRLELFRLEA